MSYRRIAFVLVFLTLCTMMTRTYVSAQSVLASITGRVFDPNQALIADATVTAKNINTGVETAVHTDQEGIYHFTNLDPGPYSVSVTKSGFNVVLKPDVILHIADSISMNFTMKVGTITETITVASGAQLVDTASGSVSTVVDHTYVENIPLSGRSFQSLILLTPGIVTTSPQQGATIGDNGEFSVNGQRTESNYYTVDGVSANVGAAPGDTLAGVAGGLPAATGLGTTQPLVSVEALEEFRVASSTYSAEYGRSPGGQFSFITKSGTNRWHGGLFDYLRNDFFDANNWFNDYFHQGPPPLRQNDFGGTLGGPVKIPRLYDGTDHTFFFFSYEGLRLVQPQASNLSAVPDNALRQSAASAVQPLLNAFPVPNGPEILANGSPSGLAQFVGTWSNPSSLDAYSVRVDHNIASKTRLFFRFSDTPSTVASRLFGDFTGTPSIRNSLNYLSRAYTVGATSLLSNSWSNEFRLNYASNTSNLVQRLDNFAGATPVNLAQLQGLPSGGSYFVTAGFIVFGGNAPQIVEGIDSTHQRQWNITDSVGISHKAHQLKFGFDYRRLTPLVQVGGTQMTYYFLTTAGDAQNNNPAVASTTNQANAYPLYGNFSAFAQDEWHVSSRLSLSLGLRWDVNPAPGVNQGLAPYTVAGQKNLSTMTLAPRGTSLWPTTWYNVAPRLGAAYVLHDAPGHETVVRAGGGLFFDTGQQLGSLGFGGPGFRGHNNMGYLYNTPVSFPLPLSDVAPIVTNPTAPYEEVFAYAEHLQLPYTLQWSAALEQAFGSSQALSLSYVASHASRLLEHSQLNLSTINPSFTTVDFIQSGPTADYDSLQVQFQRRLERGLTALAGYTWSHSIDYGSQNISFPYLRGNSDFDVRHNFAGALSYTVPYNFGSKWKNAVLGHWGVDDRFTARTGFPVTLNGPQLINPVNGQTLYAGLDVVGGQPLYLYGANCATVLQGLNDLSAGQGCPGGRAVNPNAFAAPAGCTQFVCSPGAGEGDAPRNFVRGFGAWQMDLAIRREFPILENAKLQFRAEAFNVFNHPNFGMINPNFGQQTFGQATQTLNASLGTLSSLYQMGGPRALQFALKIVF